MSKLLSTMQTNVLSVAARVATSVVTVVLVLVAHRFLFRRYPRRRSLGLAAAGGWLAVALLFSWVPTLAVTLRATFPLGVVAGVAAAVASQVVPAARRAFDALDDTEVRVLLSFRAIYGALLLALASHGELPLSFGVEAGLGDVAITCLAFAVPARLDGAGPRWARLLVHGAGLLDISVVLVMALTVVRPWSIAHGNAMTVATLPWIVVPLMFALNAHGVRGAARAAVANAVVDGSEPARGVRGAL